MGSRPRNLGALLIFAMLRKTTLLLSFPAFFLVAPSAPLEAQHVKELGVFFTTASSDHVELPSPRGGGARALFHLGGGWMARLSVHRVTDETHEVRQVCTVYSPRIDCHSELTHNTVAFSGLRGAILWGTEFGDRAWVGAGGGASFSQIDAESVADSGGRGDLLSPNTGQLGYLVLVSAGWAPLASLPMKLVGTFTNHWVDFRSCSDNEPPEYAPYCGIEPLRELEVGLAYSF